jgi:SAM-dependent methyltransferase
LAGAARGTAGHVFLMRVIPSVLPDSYAAQSDRKTARSIYSLLGSAGGVYARLMSPVSYMSRRFIWRVRGTEGVGGDVCVDVGAGSAPYERVLRTALGVRHYIAVDICPSDCTNVIADGACLPFASRTVDLAVSFDVIQHLPQPEKMLDEVARMLKPGAYFLLTFPFIYPECGVWDFHRWTMKAMEQELRCRGLEPAILNRRGGLLFVLASHLNWAMQHLDRSQRRSWRAQRSLSGLLRAAVFALLTAPTTLMGWAGLLIDHALPFQGCYMGAAILARRQACQP